MMLWMWSGKKRILNYYYLNYFLWQQRCVVTVVAVVGVAARAAVIVAGVVDVAALVVNGIEFDDGTMHD